MRLASCEKLRSLLSANKDLFFAKYDKYRTAFAKVRACASKDALQHKPDAKNLFATPKVNSKNDVNCNCLTRVIIKK